MVIFGGTGPAEQKRVGPDDLHQCYARSVSLESSLNSLNGALPASAAAGLAPGDRSVPAAKAAPAAVLFISQSKLFAESALDSASSWLMRPSRVILNSDCSKVCEPGVSAFSIASLISPISPFSINSAM